MKKYFYQKVAAEFFILLLVLVLLASISKDFPDHTPEQNKTPSFIFPQFTQGSSVMAVSTASGPGYIIAPLRVE
jgi:hypothetical protein